MKKKPIVVAVDGPGASGKGTVGRKLAKELGLDYLDTGKIYRAVAHIMICNGFKKESFEEEKDRFESHAISVADKLSFDALKEYQKDDALSGDDVAVMASIISQIPKVRATLLDFQRKVAASPRGAVLDGRDIGTIVCPDADFKFFITASLEERAKRRYKDLKLKNIEVIYDTLLQELKDRDDRDKQREVAPMRPAEDAILLDTTELSIEEVLEIMLQTVKNANST